MNRLHDRQRVASKFLSVRVAASELELITRGMEARREIEPSWPRWNLSRYIKAVLLERAELDTQPQLELPKSVTGDLVKRVTPPRGRVTRIAGDSSHAASSHPSHASGSRKRGGR